MDDTLMAMDVAAIIFFSMNVVVVIFVASVERRLQYVTNILDLGL